MKTQFFQVAIIGAIAQLCTGLAIGPAAESKAAASQEHSMTQIEATARDETDEWMLKAAQVESYPSLGLHSHDYFDMATSESLTAAQVGAEGILSPAKVGEVAV